MQTLFSIIASLVITTLTFIGAYKFLPLGTLEQSQLIGSSITTINANDTLSSSRSVINTNFSNLNSGKTEVSSSSIAAITSLLNLTSVGTLTTGALSTGFTAIPVSLGGTGTTTPSQYLVILGNGSAGFTVASSTGTSGQFLTSNGTGAFPNWQTSAVDQGANYTWTGTHTFPGTGNIIASSTQYTLNVGTIIATSTITVPTSEGVRAYRNAALTIGPLTLLSFDAENYDLANEHSSGTFTATSSGVYFVHAQMSVDFDQLVNTNYDLIIRKNNVGVATTSNYNWGTNVSPAKDTDITDVIQLNTGDTITVYASSSPGTQVLKVGSGYTWLNVFKR